MKEKLVPFLKELQTMYGVKVERFRCDNAGENRALEDKWIEKDLGIIFEYTAPGLPQQKRSYQKGICDNAGKN